jgi:hypothetical protein
LQIRVSPSTYLHRINFIDSTIRTMLLIYSYSIYIVKPVTILIGAITTIEIYTFRQETTTDSVLLQVSTMD